MNLTSTYIWTGDCGALGYPQATVKDPQNNQHVEHAFHFRYVELFLYRRLSDSASVSPCFLVRFIKWCIRIIRPTQSLRFKAPQISTANESKRPSFTPFYMSPPLHVQLFLNICFQLPITLKIAPSAPFSTF